MSYESFDQLANDFASLRGNQISEAGWDAIATFAEHNPPGSIIYDCFSEGCESAIQDAIKQMHQTREPRVNDVISKPELLQPVAKFLVGLSFLAVKDGGDVVEYSNIYARSPGMGMHVDVNSGHTALANFNVSGSPRYLIQTGIDPDGEKAINPFGKHFKIFGEDKPIEPTEQVVPIKSRQLVLLSGNAIRADEIGVDNAGSAELRQQMSTIPHAAFVDDEEDYRDLLLAYAVHTD